MIDWTWGGGGFAVSIQNYRSHGEGGGRKGGDIWREESHLPEKTTQGPPGCEEHQLRVSSYMLQPNTQFAQ